MSTEDQADDWCMGNMDGYEIVGAYWEAAVVALWEAMDNTINQWPILLLASTDETTDVDTNNIIVISNY